MINQPALRSRDVIWPHTTQAAPKKLAVTVTTGRSPDNDEYLTLPDMNSLLTFIVPAVHAAQASFLVDQIT